MDNEREQQIVKTEGSGAWYTEEFVYESVIKYLNENGYKIHKEDAEAVERKERIIIASRYFTKEIIHVKGLPHESNRTKLLKEVASSVYPSSSILATFTDTIFNSLVNFGKYYSDENSDLAMALPDNDRYKSIIERLSEYFSANDLSLKIYLVNESGDVAVSNLNE
jgi:hypothetical protein